MGINISSASQAEQIYTDASSSSEKVISGELDSQEVQTSTEVDASTKDDELMSNIQSEKNSKKAIKKQKNKEQKKLSKVDQTDDSKRVNEQDQRSKRISKQTEVRLNLINSTTNQDLQSTIEKRSNALFSGSEQKYSACFDTLDKSNMEQKLDSDAVENALKKFDDIAEQHNALQIIKDVWERKLSNLKKFSQELKFAEKRDDDPDAFSNHDYSQLQKQIQQLENSLNILSQAQDKIMLKAGNRIEDSYKLAPLLRETTAHFTHDVSLPPKAFNALILDQILPLKGDIIKTFNCLTQGFIENISDNNTKDRIQHFSDNISIIKQCLNNELKCCPDPKIASAVLNACRSAEKLESIHNLHEQVLIQAYTAFKNLGN